MSTVTVTVKGLEEALAIISELPAKLTQMAAAPVYRRAERIMTDSKQHYVPVDTGNLRSTGHVDPPVVGGEEVTVDLGFGGTAANGAEVGYALRVHEDLQMHHRVGQAKYLETPLRNDITSGKAAEGIGLDLARLIASELNVGA